MFEIKQELSFLKTQLSVKDMTIAKLKNYYIVVDMKMN